jgi:hypothetical protein
MEDMRSTLLVVVMLCGCQATLGPSRGVTQKKMSGNVSLVFTNASPAMMCNVSIALDSEREYGDNWLQTSLPTGQSAEFKVKPGKYKATWNTCSQPGKPFYAGTMWRETAVNVTESTQLFAYVADTVAPTKRAKPRDYYKLVRFAGQMVDPDPKAREAEEKLALQAKEEPPAPVAAPAPEPAKPAFRSAEWIDPKASRNAGGKKAAIKPSLKRAHDLVEAKVNYRQK